MQTAEPEFSPEQQTQVQECRSQWLTILSEIATESRPGETFATSSDYVTRRQRELESQYGDLIFRHARKEASQHFFNNGRWP